MKKHFQSVDTKISFIVGVVEMKIADYSVLESAQNVEISFERKYGSDGVIRVNWETIDDNAIKGIDYKTDEREIIFSNNVVCMILKIKCPINIMDFYMSQFLV